MNERERGRAVALMEKIVTTKAVENADVRAAFELVEIAALRRDEREGLQQELRATMVLHDARLQEIAAHRLEIRRLEALVATDERVIDRIVQRMPEPIPIHEAIADLRQAIEARARHGLEGQLATAVLELQAALEEDGQEICQTCAGVGKIIDGGSVVDCQDCMGECHGRCGRESHHSHHCGTCVYSETDVDDHPCVTCKNIGCGPVCHYERQS